MLYLIKYQKLRDGKDIYSLFETHTDSVITVSESTVLELINKHGMEVKNIYIENNRIRVKDWPHAINLHSMDRKDRESEYILLSTIHEIVYKLVDTSGMIMYEQGNQLRKLIDQGKIANCGYEDTRSRVHKSIDTYVIDTDPEFIATVVQKYTEFEAKIALLGLDANFRYKIENKDVKLTAYTGRSNLVVIPSFITTICNEAFAYRGITEVKLNHGLKHIGNKAFYGNNLKYVAIPETVEFIGQGAFHYNADGAHNKKIYKKLNPDTLIIH